MDIFPTQNLILSPHLSHTLLSPPLLPPTRWFPNTPATHSTSFTHKNPFISSRPHFCRQQNRTLKLFLKNFRSQQLHNPPALITLQTFVATTLIHIFPITILYTHHIAIHPTTPLCPSIHRLRHLWPKSLSSPLARLLQLPLPCLSQLSPLNRTPIFGVWMGEWLSSCLLLTETPSRSEVSVCVNIWVSDIHADDLSCQLWLPPDFSTSITMK